MLRSYKKVSLGGVAGVLLAGIFVSETEVLEFYDLHKGTEIMELENWKQKCKYYEQCQKQYHIDVKAVSGTISVEPPTASGGYGSRTFNSFPFNG